MSDELESLFASRPDTVHVEGVGEVPVTYEPEPEPPAPVFPDDRLRWAPGVAWHDLAGELVIARGSVHAAHVLNHTAGLLWQCMDGEGTVREIFADLASAFAVEVQTVEHDFVPLISDWKRDGLVVDANPPEAPGHRTERHVTRRRFLAYPPND